MSNHKINHNLSMVGYENLSAFHLSDGFVYMTDLLDATVPPRALVPSNSHFGHAKRNLYESAAAGLTGEMKGLTSLNGTSPITTALDLLQTIAQSERSKEIKAIKQYKEKIDKSIPTRWKNNAEFQKNYNDVMNCLNSDGTFVSDADITKFHLNLIKEINLIRQDVIDYTARLKQITNEKRRKNTNGTGQRELDKDQYLFRLFGDIDTMYKEMIGIASRKIEDSFSSQIQRYVYKYASKYQLHSKTKIRTADYMALMAAIMADIERFVQEEYNKELLEDPETSFENGWTDELLEKAYNKYLEADANQATILQQAIQGDQKELDRIIGSFKSLLGIQTLKKADIDERTAKINHYLKKDAESKKRKRGSNKRNELYKKLISSNSATTRKRAEQMRALTWKVKNDSIHGTIFEAVSTIIANAFSTTGTSAAEDSLVIGTVEGTINDKVLRNLLKERGNSVLNSIKDYYRKTAVNTTRDRHKLFTQQSQELNEAIQTEIMNMQKDLNKTSDFPEDIFVYHESLKLYTRIEKDNGVNEFEGREINILSALDRLYTLAGIGEFILPQLDTLIAIIANLSDLAAGANNKTSLATYLSIFAGLLMFEDVRNVALNAVQQLEQSNVHEIHLYLLNGVYVPSSVILTNIYQIISSQGTLAADKAAKVEIHTSKATSVIQQYVAKRNGGAPYDDSEWGPIADSVIQGTQIQIIFLAGFVQLLNDLSKL